MPFLGIKDPSYADRHRATINDVTAARVTVRDGRLEVRFYLLDALIFALVWGNGRPRAASRNKEQQ